MNVARCDAVDRHVEAAHPGQRAAGDDDVVERDVPLVLADAAAAQDPALDDHPLVDRERAGDEVAEHRLEVTGLRLGQEPDLAEVEPEQRDVDLGDRPGGAQERAVATEDDEGVGRAAAPRGAGPGRRPAPATPRRRGPGTSRTPGRCSSTAASLVGL